MIYHVTARPASPPLTHSLPHSSACPGRAPRLYNPADTCTILPPPQLACECGGRDHSPQYTGRPGGRGEAVQQPTSRSALFIRTLSDFTFLLGPAICTGPGAISMKVEWVQGAPPHSHTQLHTQVLGRLCGSGQGLPSTIVFSLGLSLPTAVVWSGFYSCGAKG